MTVTTHHPLPQAQPADVGLCPDRTQRLMDEKFAANKCGPATLTRERQVITTSCALSDTQ